MIAKYLLRFVQGLKFPWLFALTAGLFAMDLVLPDFLPFVDELLLGLVTLLLGTWRATKQDRKSMDHPTLPDDGRQP